MGFTINLYVSKRPSGRSAIKKIGQSYVGTILLNVECVNLIVTNNLVKDSRAERSLTLWPKHRSTSQMA